MPSQKPLLHIIMDEGLLAKIDDYRFGHRFKSRAAAIKWLLEWSLQQNPKPPNGEGQVIGPR
ncbi:MAG: hypothetical protein Q8Q52_01335 [Acidimicrobiia bacterium]|nr:hypothetical protein [Acidimicrobiia bacterium]